MTTTTRIDRLNILMVDDQPSKLVAYEAILGDLGENLFKASSAAEALECLLRNEIAIVLVDVCMPELDGYELAAMIRQHPRCQQASIIFVSAVMHGDVDRLRGYECGAVDYVLVPVVPEILRAKVGVFADLYRKTKALARLNAELEERVCQRTAALEASTAALREADKRKDEFLALLAHELRNPLAPIRTATHLLGLRGLPETERERTRAIIERQVDHMVRLVDDLLDVSRITRGMITLQRQTVPIDAIVESAVELARPAIDGRRHALTIDPSSETLVVDGDKTRLVQVLANLLGNAAKYSHAEGRIQVRVFREGALGAISVRDSGFGIPKEQLPTVFDLFTRVHAKFEHTEGGLGVGLALARRLTEMHGGTITAMSDGPGLGSEFVVRLPLLPSAELLAALDGSSFEAVPAPPVVAARRILLADDNRDGADALATQLAQAGHEVRTVYGGLEALAVGRTFEPQVVLLDLGMAGLDGYDTARQIRLEPWGQRAMVVAITGWGQDQDRAKSAAAGFDAHLVKPVSESELFQALSPPPMPWRRASASPGR